MACTDGAVSEVSVGNLKQHSNLVAKEFSSHLDSILFVYLPTEANWRAAYLHELSVFPYGKHDDQADSTSQALDWAKQYPARLPMGEFHERQLRSPKLGLPDEYIFKQCDEGEEIIAESILTGERIRWNGRYWEKYS